VAVEFFDHQYETETGTYQKKSNNIFTLTGTDDEGPYSTDITLLVASRMLSLSEDFNSVRLNGTAKNVA